MNTSPPPAPAQRRPSRTDSAPFSAALEQRVAAHHQALYGRRGLVAALLRTAGVSAVRLPQSTATRTVLASALLMALVGMACEIPTSSRVELGHRVVVRFLPAAGASGDARIEAALRTALQPLGVDALRIGVTHTDDGIATLDVVAWGEHVTPELLEKAVTRQIGVDGIDGEDTVLTVDIRALHGTVDENLGRRMGRSLFGLELAHDTAEELRAAILQQLAAEGFDGTANVQVQEDGSVRRIQIEADSKDGSRQIADEIILDTGNDH